MKKFFFSILIILLSFIFCSCIQEDHYIILRCLSHTPQTLIAPNGFIYEHWIDVKIQEQIDFSYYFVPEYTDKDVIYRTSEEDVLDVTINHENQTVTVIPLQSGNYYFGVYSAKFDTISTIEIRVK